MVARPDQARPKPTARRALAHASAVYLSQAGGAAGPSRGAVAAWREEAGPLVAGIPVYTRQTLASLVETLRGLSAAPGEQARGAGGPGRAAESAV